MANKSLIDLGISLSNDFQALVHNYTSGWLTDCVFRREDWQEIDNLFQATAQVEQVINESEVWEKLLTTGFIPSDFANDSNVNLGEETTSDEREKIHPYLETWKRYESLVNLDAPISTASRQSIDTDRRSHPDSPFSPIIPNQVNSVAETSSTSTVASQRLQANGQAGNNQPVLGKLSEDIEVSGSNQVGRGMHITEPSSLQLNSDLYSFSEISPVDNSASQNPDDWQSQVEKIRNFNPKLGSEAEELFPNEAIHPDNSAHSAKLSSSIKGLKDLAKFLESQPNLEYILAEDLPTQPAENITDFIEPVNPEELSPFADSSSALYPTVQDIGTVADFAEQLAQNAGLAELGKQALATEAIAALPNHSQHNETGVEPIPMNSDRNPELDMDLILGAIAQEINREYRRFYGE